MPGAEPASIAQLVERSAFNRRVVGSSPAGGIMDITWKYRCSICGQLIHSDNMMDHTQRHKIAPDWRGAISYSRVDDVTTEN